MTVEAKALTDEKLRERLRQIIAAVTARRESRRCKTLDEAHDYEQRTYARILSCSEPDELADAILASGLLSPETDTLQARLKDVEAQLKAACARERTHLSDVAHANRGRMEWFERATKAEARVKEAGTDRRTPGTVEVCPNRLLTIGACYFEPENAACCSDPHCPLRSTPPALPTTAQDGGGT